MNANKPTGHPVLKTRRLALRPFTLSDSEDVRKLAGERDIADTTLNIPHPYEEGMAEKWISTHMAGFDENTSLTFAITCRKDGKLLGAVSLTVQRSHSRAELGYWIGKPYWGNGYCTEAAHAVMEYGFTVLRLNRIFATFMTRNPASGRVMEKLGMKSESIMRQHYKKWDKFEDMAMYGILKDEWISEY
ncbi:MAG: GNAT family N-acetyltransferase [Candidatus Aegiribacteria sp.]|nr:GNAT family N-acetyltransferase [Candidatus Aegiribacteria sp.]